MGRKCHVKFSMLAFNLFLKAEHSADKLNGFVDSFSHYWILEHDKYQKNSSVASLPIFVLWQLAVLQLKIWKQRSIGCRPPFKKDPTR